MVMLAMTMLGVKMRMRTCVTSSPPWLSQKKSWMFWTFWNLTNWGEVGEEG